MKYLIIIAALLCFIAIFDLPQRFYLLLRIIVSLMALIIILNEFRSRSFWFLAFLFIFIIFNPIFPIYLYLKSFWIVIEVLAGLLFSYYFYTLIPKKKEKEPKTIDVKHQEIPKTRDRIIK